MVKFKGYEFLPYARSNSMALFKDGKEVPKDKYEEIFVELFGDSEAVRAFAKFCAIYWTVPEEDKSKGLQDLLLDLAEEQIKAKKSTATI